MKIKEILLDALFTPNGTCPICGRVLFSRDQFLCGNCKDDLPLVLLDTCAYCGRGVAGSSICKDCVKVGEKAPDGGCTWLEYSGMTQKLVAGMKFEHRRHLCTYVGREMANIIAAQAWVKDLNMIVPVPIHSERLKERGYNQSLLIAQGMSSELKQLLTSDFPVNEVLCRVINTPHQVGKGRSDRLINLNEAFEMQKDTDVQGKTLLLIDDVLTTGATTRACIEVLRQAGAKKVYLAVCAAVTDFSRA